MRTAIDFDDFYRTALADCMAATKLLADHGRLFLFIEKDNDFIFSKDQCLSELKPPSDTTISIYKSCVIPDINHLRICNFAALDYFATLEYFIIPYIRLHPELITIELTTVPPQETNHSGDPYGPKYPNTAITTKSLEQYLKLFLPKNINCIVNFLKDDVEFYDEFKRPGNSEKLIVREVYIQPQSIDSLTSTTTSEQFTHNPVQNGEALITINDAKQRPEDDGTHDLSDDLKQLVLTEIIYSDQDNDNNSATHTDLSRSGTPDLSRSRTPELKDRFYSKTAGKNTTLFQTSATTPLLKYNLLKSL